MVPHTIVYGGLVIMGYDINGGGLLLLLLLLHIYINIYMYIYVYTYMCDRYSMLIE